MEVDAETDNVESGRDFVRIKGRLFATMLFVTMDGEVELKKAFVPFEHTVDSCGADSNTLCDLKLEIDSYSFNILSASSVELRANLSFGIRVKKCVSLSLVEKMEQDSNCKMKNIK